MAIASAIERGSLVFVYDERGLMLYSKPKGSGPTDGLLGFTPLPSPCVRARPSSPMARPAKLSTQSRRDGLCNSVCLSRFPPADPHRGICHTPASQAASPHRVLTSSRLLKTQPIDAVGTIDRSSMLADERHDRSIIEGADRTARRRCPLRPHANLCRPDQTQCFASAGPVATTCHSSKTQFTPTLPAPWHPVPNIAQPAPRERRPSPTPPRRPSRRRRTTMRNGRPAATPSLPNGSRRCRHRIDEGSWLRVPLQAERSIIGRCRHSTIRSATASCQT